MDDAISMLFFDSIPNVGDICGPSMVAKVTGKRISVARTLDYKHLVACCSMLDICNENSIVWGSGYSHEQYFNNNIRANNIYALRGQLSWTLARQNGIPVKDVPLGDTGFLAPRIFDIHRRNTNDGIIGIVPHYVDMETTFFLDAKKEENVMFLDVRSEPQKFLRAMAACDVVVSSSLHGLIFAEALGIPNVWISVSNNVLGGGFKFRDWFTLAARPQTVAIEPGDRTNIGSVASRAHLHEMRIDKEALELAMMSAYRQMGS